MDSKALIQAYMRAKNFSQYQQVAAELGFTKSHISSLTTGKVQLTDATAKRLAQEIGLDVQEVLLSLAAVRDKSRAEKGLVRHPGEVHQRSRHGCSPCSSGVSGP